MRLWFKENCDPYKDQVLPEAPAELVEGLGRVAEMFGQPLKARAPQSFDPREGEPTQPCFFISRGQRIPPIRDQPCLNHNCLSLVKQRYSSLRSFRRIGCNDILKSAKIPESCHTHAGGINRAAFAAQLPARRLPVSTAFSSSPDRGRSLRGCRRSAPRDDRE